MKRPAIFSIMLMTLLVSTHALAGGGKTCTFNVTNCVHNNLHDWLIVSTWRGDDDDHFFTYDDFHPKRDTSVEASCDDDVCDLKTWTDYAHGAGDEVSREHEDKCQNVWIVDNGDSDIEIRTSGTVGSCDGQP